MRPQRTQLPSFRTLYDEQVAYVWRVLQRDGVPERELEDACEAVFLSAHRESLANDVEARDAREQRTSEERSVRAWMGALASQVALEERHRERRGRELLRPLSPGKYDEGDRAQAASRARMFASGPSVEARARMFAQLAGELGPEHASSFPDAAVQQGATRLWLLRVALGISVVLGGAALQLQDGCSRHERDATARARAALAANTQTAGSPDSAAGRMRAR